MERILGEGIKGSSWLGYPEYVEKTCSLPMNAPMIGVIKRIHVLVEPQGGFAGLAKELRKIELW